ncbi:MAG: hypothetical protein IIC64_09105 [SAR324 cluster bacterium]|nr:hypothetical protein [SAR324 cluster bacterium]
MPHRANVAARASLPGMIGARASLPGMIGARASLPNRKAGAPGRDDNYG